MSFLKLQFLIDLYFELSVQAKIMRSPVDSDTIMNLLDKIKVYKEEKADHLLDLASEKNESQNLQPSSTKLSIVRSFILIEHSRNIDSFLALFLFVVLFEKLYSLNIFSLFLG